MFYKFMCALARAHGASDLVRTTARAQGYRTLCAFWVPKHANAQGALRDKLPYIYIHMYTALQP